MINKNGLLIFAICFSNSFEIAHAALFKKVPKKCLAVLIEQAPGCQDCGLVAFVNSLPWVDIKLAPAELRRIYENIKNERPEIDTLGIYTDELIEAIKHDAIANGIMPQIITLNALKENDQGILLLTRQLGTYGHYVSLIGTRKISPYSFEVDLVYPEKPNEIKTTRLMLQHYGDARLEVDSEHELDVVEPHAIIFD